MFEPRPRSTAPRDAEYVCGSSAEQPAAQSIAHKLAFYNVGWNATDKKRNAAWLAREICPTEKLTLLASAKSLTRNKMI